MAHLPDLAQLVVTHHGNRSAIARDLTARGLRISSSTVTIYLRQAGLEDAADALAFDARRPGPRPRVTADDRAAEVARITGALLVAQTQNGRGRHRRRIVEQAAKRLGMPVATLWRRLRDYQIPVEG